MKIVVAALVGLVAGVLVAVVFNFVPAVGAVVPEDWHSAVTGGVAGALAVASTGLVGRRKS